MGIRELKEKYGKRSTVGAVNAAIRAECPGGAAVLDAATALHPVLSRSSGRTRRDLETTFELLRAARDAMKATVARNYGLKTFEENEGAENEA